MTKTTTGRSSTTDSQAHQLRESIIASRNRNLTRIMRQKGHGWFTTAIVLRFMLFLNRLGLPLSLNAAVIILIFCLIAGITTAIFILLYFLEVP